MVFRVPNSCLFLEGPLGEQRDDPDLAVGNHVRKLCGSERADRETVTRREFRMGPRAKHYLGNNFFLTFASTMTWDDCLSFYDQLKRAVAEPPREASPHPHDRIHRRLG